MDNFGGTTGTLNEGISYIENGQVKYLGAWSQGMMLFNTTASSAYNTEIPLNKALTVMTGKTLTSNDTFTILAAPVNEAACRVVLIGNGTNIPVFTNFDEITGEYDATLNTKNIILFYRLESVNYVNITQTTSV